MRYVSGNRTQIQLIKVALCALAILHLAACGPKLIKRGRNTRVSPVYGPNRFDANQEGGSVAVQTTTSFGISKVSAGGNYQKISASTSSFKVTGGVHGK